MMRDAGPYFTRWRGQIERAAMYLANQGDQVVCVVLENDSTDDTRDRLRQFAETTEFEVVWTSVETGSNYWPSVDHPDRWRHLARLCEKVRLLQAGTGADTHVYVECDLRWDPKTVADLVKLSQHQPHAAFSPMLMCDWDRSRYYDTWGTEGIDGVCFTAEPPHHDHLRGAEYVNVNSVAGMTVVSDTILRNTTWVDEHRPECYRTWNRSMREAGYGVVLSKWHYVYHPEPSELRG
jgi:hypothetical protein